ncbi:MAG: peptide deformylase [candidate division Zixibacteria bacterium]|nr:peptide deformylase [candidate division Zixibacteria bacterium]
MIQDIRLFGDEVLRMPAEDVCDFGAHLQQLASDLLMTQAEAKAVGLAAVQIGVEQNVFSIDGSTVERRGRREVLVNPQVADSHGEMVEEEGCLSFPGIFVPISRPAWVAIRAQNLDGKEIVREATGYLARAYLHEIDHLRGRLFTDLMDADTRRDVIGKMRSLRARERSGPLARFFPFARTAS